MTTETPATPSDRVARPGPAAPLDRRLLLDMLAQLPAGAGVDRDTASAALIWRRPRWSKRLQPAPVADLLDEDPAVEAGLRSLVEEVAAGLPQGSVSALGYSVAAGRDVRITASGGGTAAGVIHGNVGTPGPTVPGPAQG